VSDATLLTHVPEARATDTAAVQRRTLRLLFVTQIISGVGMAIGASVGALLAAEMAGVSLSGLAQSSVVIGAALYALPATAIVRTRGRRPSLAALYFIAACGGLIVVASATLNAVALLYPGFFLLGGATAAGLQARYAAVDLAPAALRGRHLSIVVWATTIGAVTGPHLAAIAGTSLAPWGVPTLAGPFAFSAVLFALSAALLMLFMRPDPIVVARSLAGAAEAPVQAFGMSAALRAVLASPPARLAITAVAIGHFVMVAVMAMTPVHVRSAGHDAAHTLRIVGIVLSLHIAGMYAFSPVMGWLTDRLGRKPVIMAGIVVLLAACFTAGTAGHDTLRLGIGLLLLGVGWSATMVAGSTLLTDSIGGHMRPSAQGLSDLIMGICGASAGALSGVIVQFRGYPALAAVAATATAPLLLLLLATRTVSPPSR
jgi:MFS family permease